MEGVEIPEELKNPSYLSLPENEGCSDGCVSKDIFQVMIGNQLECEAARKRLLNLLEVYEKTP